MSPALFLPENNESYTVRWMRNRISNFEYLLAINKCAGRTVQDCSRYSLMPWCVNSFETDLIKIHEPSYFRDLSKPLGVMLENERAATYEENYQNMSKDKEAFPFHYGTYISNCTSVLYYFMRLQPVTAAWKCFYGRVHESPERIFYSVLKHFKSITTTSQDLKESLPEFYYLPEAFMNLNRLGLIEKPPENWRIESLELPSWAKQNPYYFVYLNRIILESEIVAEKLPAWIDLVFGINQQGKRAIEHKNVYQPLVYLDSAQKLFKSSEQKGESLSFYSQIYFFGQSPYQLFGNEHPHKTQNVKPFLKPSFGIVPLELHSLNIYLPENQPHPTIISGLSINHSTVSLLSSHNALQYKISRPSLLTRIDKKTQVSRLASNLRLISNIDLLHHDRQENPFLLC